ncbi:nuclear transport factor 2 family protein [Rhodococcus sp. 14C212]|uniref:nuclear transport factor 2 family protein n=1 Tax=Rhodococcus sp. 14C212 TaxID=2711209 RepID=UPI0013EAA3AB|nr:nuclear transport factor 2 family protein [Rhodococcus sp. 14C212]NGP05848.1 nuclear transport factor 2 family protein [Rhodococcus sp. 14C212]
MTEDRHPAPTVHPDAASSWSLLTDRIARESDPILRRNLDVVARHVVAEVAGDLEALKATLVADPRYSFWGGESPTRLRSMVEVEAFYENNMRVGKNRLSFDITRVLVDESTVITEGVFRHVVKGAFLLDRRLPDGGPLDPDLSYLTAYQALVVWPITPDGLIAGEEIYLGEPHQIQRAVAPGELPHLGSAR